MIFRIVLPSLLSLAHAQPYSWCQKKLTSLIAPRAPQITQLRDGQIRHVTPLSIANAKAAWALAKTIAPPDGRALARDFASSLVPRWVVPRAPALTGPRLDLFETHLLKSDLGNPIGIVSHYAPARTLDLWIGSLGIYPRARREGLGKALVDWSLARARDRGFVHARTWTTDGERHANVNRLFARAGFVRQRLEACDPEDPSAQIVIWSRALRADREPERFMGNYAEVLFGLSEAQIEAAIRHYDRTRNCGGA